MTWTSAQGRPILDWSGLSGFSPRLGAVWGQLVLFPPQISRKEVHCSTRLFKLFLDRSALPPPDVV